MITRPALIRLGEFKQDPSAEKASQLVGIPVLFNVLKLHSAPYNHDLLGLCKWLHSIGHTALSRLFREVEVDTRQTIPEESLVEEDWRKVH
jgi:hypothetical protein